MMLKARRKERKKKKREAANKQTLMTEPQHRSLILARWRSGVIRYYIYTPSLTTLLSILQNCHNENISNNNNNKKKTHATRSTLPPAQTSL